MKLKVRAALLWFTAGICGFVLGYLFGRATAKRVYISPPPSEQALASQKNFRLILLRTAIFGITCGLAIFCAWYFTKDQPQNLNLSNLSDNRAMQDNKQNPLALYNSQFLYLTDPPQVFNPETNKLEYLNPYRIPESSRFRDYLNKLK